MLDKRIGKYNEYAPRVCAVTETAIQSGASGYALTKEYYIKVNPGRIVTVDLLSELLQVVAPKRQPKKTIEE